MAILVELADEGHGDDRDNWAVEAIFGLQHDRIPPSFPSAGKAAEWIGGYVRQGEFIPMDDLIQLP